MSLVGGYDNDIFISYSHIDNEPFGNPKRGWVDIFQEELQTFVNFHAGRKIRVWRDKGLAQTQIVSDEIGQQLRRSVVLVAIISPGYMRSVWCNRELVAFTKSAQEQGNFRVGNLQRAIKVLRLPMERTALPALLDDVLPKEFYRIDSVSGHPRDLLIDESEDARRVFSSRVYDVARDLARLLDAVGSGGAVPALPPTNADTVFLAWSTGDLAEEREKLRRELEARNCRVLPAGALPLETGGLRDSIIAALKDAKVAIHLIGANYGFVPEGEARSVIELQCDETIYQASSSSAARVFWLAPNAQPQDDRQKALIERIQTFSPKAGRVDVLANQTIEALKSLVLDRLKPVAKTVPSTVRASAVVYLMCDQPDRPAVAPIQDYLFGESLEVRLPLFAGSSDQIREEHYETLKECNGALLFWGKAQEGWVRSRLRDLNKVFGLGRNEPYRAASLYLAGLPDSGKESFRTGQVSIIRSNQEFEPRILRPFVDQLSSA